MPKEMQFFIYLLEHYAEEKGLPAGQVLDTWDRLGLTSFFFDMYEMYHSEAIENAYADIDARVEAKRRESVTEPDGLPE